MHGLYLAHGFGGWAVWELLTKAVLLCCNVCYSSYPYKESNAPGSLLWPHIWLITCPRPALPIPLAIRLWRFGFRHWNFRGWHSQSLVCMVKALEWWYQRCGFEQSVWHFCGWGVQWIVRSGRVHCWNHDLLDLVGNLYFRGEIPGNWFREELASIRGRLAITSKEGKESWQLCDILFIKGMGWAFMCPAQCAADMAVSTLIRKKTEVFTRPS